MKMIDDNLTDEERRIEVGKGYRFLEAVIDGHIGKAKNIMRSLHNIDMKIMTQQENPMNYEEKEEHLTPLMISLKHGTLDLVKYALEVGADPNNCDSRTYSSNAIPDYTDPIEYTITNKKFNELKILIDYGGDINRKIKHGRTRDEDGCDLLTKQIIYGEYETVEFLIECGASPNYRLKNLLTPYTLSQGLIEKINVIQEIMLNNGDLFDYMVEPDSRILVEKIERHEGVEDYQKISELMWEKSGWEYRR